METKNRKISFYNDGLIGSIFSRSKRSKQKFTISPIDLIKDQGKEGTLHRKNMIQLIIIYEQNYMHGLC